MAITRDTNPTVQNELEKYEKERFRSYNNTKYNWNAYSYPENLGRNPDLRHYVAFFINVREKSKSENRYDTFDKNEVPILRTTKKPTAENYGVALPKVLALQTALTVAGIQKVGSISNATKGKNPREAAANVVKSVLTFIFTGLATKEISDAALRQINILGINNFSRLKDVITLHIEDRPTVKYGMNYTEKDLGVLAGFFASFASQSESWQNTLNSSFGAEALALGAIQLAKIPSAIGGATISDLLGAAAGVKINPFREVLFESIDYRTFNFKYRFFPKSEKETNAVKNIIDKFKEHMHPDLSANGFFFIYPSEFEIVYYYINPKTEEPKENIYFNRIASCALTDMSVEYGGDTFSTFNNGAPTQINLTLTFRELEQLTKREMKRGF